MIGSPQLSAPVVIMLFNRPEETARVFEIVARARPRTLLLVADGPRATVPSDAERCTAARAVVGRIDWPCDVLRNFSDHNLGCLKRCASGLDWAFSQVDYAIVLEDDCLPHPSFFSYAETLLERYYHDERVVHIAGTSLGQPFQTVNESYFYSRFPFVWGWATWRRAWQHYDISMSDWPTLRQSGWLRTVLPDPNVAAAWESIFDHVHADSCDDWAFQWIYTCWRLDGLSIIPCVNLVSNIGIVDGAAHMNDPQKWGHLMNRPVQAAPSVLTPPIVLAPLPSIEALIFRAVTTSGAAVHGITVSDLPFPRG